jgi:hypothetical protein
MGVALLQREQGDTVKAMRTGRIWIVIGICLTVILLKAVNAGNKGDPGVTDSTKGAEMSELTPQISWIPAGKPKGHTGWINGYARGLELLLKHQGHDVDFDLVMGDMGLAFIMQAEEGTKGSNPGWWPLAPLGTMRLNFLEKSTGREIKDMHLSGDECRKTPQESYRDRIRPMIASSIGNGIPCVARVGSSEYIVTGFDDSKDFPLLGMCINEKETEERIYRIEEPMPPYVLYTIGRPVQPVDRREADIEALRYAIALHRDRVIGPDVKYNGKYPLRRSGEFSEYWRTGKKSFLALIGYLEDDERYGQHFWYANVTSHLRLNRESAVRYLKAMQKRHSGAFVSHLANAADAYDKVAKRIGTVNTSRESIDSKTGRQRFVKVVKEIIELEGKAADEIEMALKSAE